MKTKWIMKTVVVLVMFVSGSVYSAPYCPDTSKGKSLNRKTELEGLYRDYSWCGTWKLNLSEEDKGILEEIKKEEKDRVEAREARAKAESRIKTKKERTEEEAVRDGIAVRIDEDPATSRGDAEKEEPKKEPKKEPTNEGQVCPAPGTGKGKEEKSEKEKLLEELIAKLSKEDKDNDDRKKKSLGKDAREGLIEHFDEEFGEMKWFDAEFLAGNFDDFKDATDEAADEILEEYFSDLIRYTQNPMTLFSDIRGRKSKALQKYFDADKQLKLIKREIKSVEADMAKLKSTDEKYKTESIKLAAQYYALNRFKKKFLDAKDEIENYSPQFAQGATGDIDYETVMMMQQMGLLNDPRALAYLMGGGQGNNRRSPSGLGVSIGSTPLGGVRLGVEGMGDVFGAGVSGVFGEDYDKLNPLAAMGVGGGGYNPTASPFADPVNFFPGQYQNYGFGG